MESFLSLGRFHIPYYGLFAALGLICAMLLSLRTARLARIDPEGMWSLGLFAVFTAFVLTRVLLVAENLRVFLEYPILVLELPSLTFGGEVATAVAVLVYMRRGRLPLLNVLDAIPPCAAVLWAFLNLGTIASGIREGMPTTLPWAIASSFGRVHPVELYSAIAWLLLSAALFQLLRRRPLTGVTAACGLISAGLLLFLMDFFRLPVFLYSNAALDGVQWRALGIVIAGTLLLAWRVAALPAPASLAASRPLDSGDLGNAL